MFVNFRITNEINKKNLIDKHFHHQNRTRFVFEEGVGTGVSDKSPHESNNQILSGTLDIRFQF